MIPLLVVVSLVLVVIAVRELGPVLRRRRLKSELDGDWWPAFERDFRSYAGTWRAARESEQRG